MRLLSYKSLLYRLRAVEGPAYTVMVDCFSFGTVAKLVVLLTVVLCRMHTRRYLFSFVIGDETALQSIRRPLRRVCDS